MHPLLEELYQKRLVTTDSGEQLPLEHVIPCGEGEFLQQMVELVKPKKSLEVGFAYGFSTMFICESLAKVGAQSHIVIDPCENTDWKGIGLTHVRQANFDKLVHFIEEPSETALPKLLKEGTTIDFAFIDGWHTFDHTLVDFFYINAMLNVGGAVVFDDANWDSIYKVSRLVSKYPAYQILGRWPQTMRGSASLAAGGDTTSVSKRASMDLSPKALKHYAETVLNELSLPRRRVMAFKKIAKDERNFDWHKNF